MSDPARPLLDKAVLLLIGGMGADVLLTFCIQQTGDAEAAKETVAEARKRITIAADYVRDEQIGKAVMRLENIYAKSNGEKDFRVALSAQRETNRLLGLYHDPDRAGVGDGSSAAQAKLDLIAGYLLPLGLAGENYPVEEHARLAAVEVTKRVHKNG